MRSLIILEVEHGEDTDLLAEVPSIVNIEFAARAMLAGSPMSRAKVTDFTVRVDLPACFVLDSTHTN